MGINASLCPGSQWDYDDPSKVALCRSHGPGFDIFVTGCSGIGFACLCAKNCQCNVQDLCIYCSGCQFSLTTA